MTKSVPAHEQRDPREAFPHLVPIGSDLPLGEYLGQMWLRRDFLFAMPRNSLRAQNQDTLLGSLWHLLNPLLLAGVFYVVFGVIFDARTGVDNYVAFLIIGVFVFTFTSKAAMAGTRSIVGRARLVQQLSFPRAILPGGEALAETWAHAYAIGAMLAVAILTGVNPALTWLGLPLVLALQALFNLGITMITARLTFHFRDTAQFLPYLTRIAMYLSGVFFPVGYVPAGWARDLFQLNPIFTTIEIHRALVIGTELKSWWWLNTSGWALLLLVVGFLFFRARETEYGRI